jgi:uncharacterized protein (TIGR03437 family)
MKRHCAGAISVLWIGIAVLFGLALCRGQGSLPSIESGGVISAGAFGAFTSVAPGSWIEIYGFNLAAAPRLWAGSDFSGTSAPTSLDGTSVIIGGQNAFIDYISPGQVNAQVPSNVGTGTQQVIVKTPGGTTGASSITVNATQPGLLAPSSFNVGGTQYAVALFSDGVTYVLPPGAIAGLPSRRAQPGDTITFYGVGFGPVIPSVPAGQIVQQNNSLASLFQVKFASAIASVSYDGLAPGEIGSYQFNVTVPTVPSSDAVPVTFTLGGVAGLQTLYIAVQSASPTPQVQSLTFSASSVAGGGTIQGTVALSTSAPPGGVVIALSSNSSAASVPATVTIPAGATSVTFTISTSSVSSNQAAMLTATYNGTSAAATLTITPPSASAFNMLLLTTTFSPSGYPSGPLAISVAPNNGTATFTALANGLNFMGCISSNGGLTFTCNSLGLGLQGFGSTGAPTLAVTSASLQFTLSPGGVPDYAGTVIGTISVTGTVSGTTTRLTISGPFTGNYLLFQ